MPKRRCDAESVPAPNERVRGFVVDATKKAQKVKAGAPTVPDYDKRDETRAFLQLCKDAWVQPPAGWSSYWTSHPIYMIDHQTLSVEISSLSTTQEERLHAAIRAAFPGRHMVVQCVHENSNHAQEHFRYMLYDRMVAWQRDIRQQLGTNNTLVVDVDLKAPLFQELNVFVYHTSAPPLDKTRRLRTDDDSDIVRSWTELTGRLSDKELWHDVRATFAGWPRTHSLSLYHGPFPYARRKMILSAADDRLALRQYVRQWIKEEKARFQLITTAPSILYHGSKRVWDDPQPRQGTFFAPTASKSRQYGQVSQFAVKQIDTTRWLDLRCYIEEDELDRKEKAEYLTKFQQMTGLDEIGWGLRSWPPVLCSLLSDEYDAVIVWYNSSEFVVLNPSNVLCAGVSLVDDPAA